MKKREALGPIGDLPLQDIARAAKMRMKFVNMYGSLKKFKGELNRFFDDIDGFTKNPRSWGNFPEVADLIRLKKAIQESGATRDAAHLSEKDIEQGLVKVMLADQPEMAVASDNRKIARELLKLAKELAEEGDKDESSQDC